MAAELGHEGLAEGHDLAVGLALGVEVGTALAAAHGKRGQRVLEDLLEAEELEHAEGDGGVEAQAALVGAERGVELHAVAAVHLHLAGVIDPGDAEHDDALRLDQALEQAGLLVRRIGVNGRCDAREYLVGGLNELRLVGVASLELVDHPLRVTHDASK